MIDYATVERILSAAQIYDVVSDFISLRKKGVNWVGLCPFHDDKTPSFTVSPAKNICKCFACGEGGTPIHFVMKHEQLSYPEALKYIAKKYGIEVKDTELTDEQKQTQSDRESMFILNGFAQKTFTQNLFETEEGATIGLSYFKERGFREDIIRKFQLGYSMEKRDAFTQEALKAGYKKEYLEKTGLIVVGDHNYMADRFRGRVMFPVHNLSGKVVAFGGRTLKEGRALKEEKISKYVNSPESEIYHKSNELYGLYLARTSITKQDRCFLVEGYTDVISMHQAGIENVVASSGTALTLEQIRLMRRFTDNVTILYDGDSAGIKAATRGIDLLLEAGLKIKVVLLPDGEDPDSFSRKQNAASFSQFIEENETDFVRFKAGLLMESAGNDIGKKAQMIDDIIGTIAKIPEEITRLLYVKECSRIVDVSEEALLRDITKKRQELQLQKKKTIYPDPENPEDAVRLAPDSSPNGVQPKQEASQVTESPLFDHERAILYYIIRYGERTLYATVDETTGQELPVKVIEHIVQELTADDLVLTHPLYRQLLEETYQRRQEEKFVPKSYFINYFDQEISRLALDLSEDKYDESRIHFKHRKKEEEEEKLMELIPYVLNNYKDAISKIRMDELNKEIKTAEENENFELLNDLLQQLSFYQKARKEFAINLRERIIPKS